MTETEALALAREETKKAIAKVGDDRAAVDREICLRAEANSKVFQAFAIVGLLDAQSSTQERH
jgi:hypothetical protein